MLKRWNKTIYELLSSPQHFLNDLINEISLATSQVDLQFYTFETDDTDLPIAEALIKARGRNITVRVLVDDFINMAHNDHYMCIPAH